MLLLLQLIRQSSVHIIPLRSHLNMSQSTPPRGVLLVGSLPVPSNEDAFKLCLALPGHLASIPDGEIGDRYNWIGWQREISPKKP
jgi:hypothetical protein